MVSVTRVRKQKRSAKPWVHLDIAGTRWLNEEKPYLAKGPTGHPVRTLVQLLCSLPNEKEDLRPGL